MTGKSKTYLLKTIVTVVLMAIGAIGVHMGGKPNVILGSFCFIMGFVIMAVLYGHKWLWWGSDLF